MVPIRMTHDREAVNEITCINYSQDNIRTYGYLNLRSKPKIDYSK